MTRKKFIPIALFTTGGTIDKDYSVDTEQLFVGPPVAPKHLLSIAAPNVRIHHRELERVDSLDMTDKTRKSIVDECGLVASERIIITHGTGTMLHTAKALHDANIDKDHTVILVGAWRPAAFRTTDAWQNLNLAYNELFKRPPGIYIAVGKLLKWDRCIKDNKRHMFLSKR